MRPDPALQKGEDLFRLLVESVSDNGLFMLDPDGYVRSWNLGAERLEGYRADEIVGKHFSVFYTEEDRKRNHPQSELDRARAGGRYEEEGWRVRKDGSKFWASVVIAPLYDGKGRLLGFGKATHDVTERRRADDLLRESEARFRTMADHSPVMLWMAGVDADCHFFNRGWLEFTGRLLETELGAGWAEGIHFEDFQNCMDVYLSSFVARKSFRMEYRLRRADGQYRWILDTGVPRYDPDGTFLGYIGSCIDITEIREARDALRRTNEDLEQRVRERTAELSGRLKEREILLREIHHRVKNNLQLVSSLLNMQERQLDDGPSRQALEECQSRVQTIALVHEQLYQSKDLARVPLSEYVRSLAENVFYSAGASRGTVTLDVEIEDLYLAVDRAIPCGLILNELITNARKHAFPEGRAGVVRVELRQTASNRFVLLVSDDGVGLPPSLDIRQTESLGLQLVCTLADQLRAELRVERGAGTAVHLEFDGDA